MGLRDLIKKRKASFDVDNAGNVIIGVMFIAILLVTLLLTFMITSTAVANSSGNVTSTLLVSNETTSSVVSGTGVNLAQYTLPSVSCAIVTVHNESGASLVINSANYTLTGCNIKSITSGLYNNTFWNVTYTATYDTTNSSVLTTNVKDIQTNLTSMIVNFFALMPTIGTILAVVILVAAIVLLVMYVVRMKNTGQTTTGFQG
jgi:hypothetical protein